ncbi:thiamine phosphate synthase [Pelagibacterales bacterium SAG-MED23]|nr:thiamine phosphate synthase [Pelagibacterales bacterium SAG-MED23]
MHKKNLKKYYFINKINKNNIDKQDKDTIIIYRNYKKKINVKDLLFLKKYCKGKRLKLLLSNNIKLAFKYNLDGAYIPAFNTSFLHLCYNLKNSFILLGSAHNLRQIRIKEKQKVNEIFISSIFKRNNNYLGINKFKIISNYSKKGIIALGGISKSNLKSVYLTNSIGFAGISYFESKKKAPRKGPFK